MDWEKLITVGAEKPKSTKGRGRPATGKYDLAIKIVGALEPIPKGKEKDEKAIRRNRLAFGLKKKYPLTIAEAQSLASTLRREFEPDYKSGALVITTTTKKQAKGDYEGRAIVFCKRIRETPEMLEEEEETDEELLSTLGLGSDEDDEDDDNDNDEDEDDDEDEDEDDLDLSEFDDDDDDDEDEDEDDDEDDDDDEDEDDILAGLF